MDIKIDLKEVSAGLRLEEGALIALRLSVRLAGVAVAAWAALRLVRFLAIQQRLAAAHHILVVGDVVTCQFGW